MQFSPAIVDFICFMLGLSICQNEPFWQEVRVESPILRWPLRPVGLLFIVQLAERESSEIFLLVCLSKEYQIPVSVVTYFVLFKI